MGTSVLADRQRHIYHIYISSVQTQDTVQRNEWWGWMDRVRESRDFMLLAWFDNIYIYIPWRNQPLLIPLRTVIYRYKKNLYHTWTSIELYLNKAPSQALILSIFYCLCLHIYKRPVVNTYICRYTRICMRTYSYMDMPIYIYLIEHYRYFLSTYFFVNPF